MPSTESSLLSLLTPIVPVFQHGSEEYKESNTSYYSAFENELEPSLIAAPTTVAHVESLIQALRPRVLKGETSLAIRGTGHTPFEGSANIQDGITIDLRGLKGVTLNEDKSAVTIGVGETWTSVYTELEKHKVHGEHGEHYLSVAGGRVSRVGVSGLVLGGGLSMFSTREGFACDSVVEFEVVLASGKTVYANKEDNSDLWIALKGGLNNFGIVTTIKMKTFETGKIWGGMIFYSPKVYSELMQRIVDFAHDEKVHEIDDGPVDTHLMGSIGFAHGGEAGNVIMYQTKGKENPSSLERFTSLKVESPYKELRTIRTSTHLEFSEELSKHSSDGPRQYWTTLTIKPDVALMKAFIEKYREALDKIRDADGLMFALGFHPLKKALLQNSENAGGNAAAIPPSDGPLLVVLINPKWTLEQDDTRVIAAVKTFAQEAGRLASEMGLLHRYVFTNYANEGNEVISGYGKESLAKLRATSQKYDPQGLFQKGVPGGFKLANTKD